MKTLLKMLAICMMAGGLGVQSVYAEPLVIQEQGSFSAGGTIITAPGTFDAKKPLDSAGQTYHGDHASVFYQIPENPHKYPIVMLHGAGQSSRTWESTPDTPNTGPFDVNVISDAMSAVVDKSGPAILFTHSQGGGPGWYTAMKNNKVKAIVAFEPGSGFVFPEKELPAPMPSAFPRLSS